MKKVCIKVGLYFGKCEDDARAVLKERGAANPTKQQLMKALNKLEEEHHLFLFVYKSNRQKCGKILEHIHSPRMLQMHVGSWQAGRTNKAIEITENRPLLQ